MANRSSRAPETLDEVLVHDEVGEEVLVSGMRAKREFVGRERG